MRVAPDTPTCDDIANRAITESCDTVLNNFWRGCNVLSNASPGEQTPVPVFTLPGAAATAALRRID
ncbi:hypothetical protein CXY01_27210 [Cellulomonas xylanilytica]|uniref:Uncharacterized protein n=1 Tax=Cellulomonas xylanilytica TaxID=233583 RepID=A0A510V8A6_9CELL|nr:hypothetical protein CXY01_27210 [Cellulomonas xylanilytica]